jgi:hypothetical protein
MALLDESANGVFIIAATPFSDNGALDFVSVVAWSISISNGARTASPSSA